MFPVQALNLKGKKFVNNNAETLNTSEQEGGRTQTVVWTKQSFQLQ